MRPRTLTALAAASLAVAIPTGIGAAAPKHGAQTPSTIITCVNKKTGAMRLVSSAKKTCKKTERRVSWVASGAGALVDGPAGPAGAAGPAGPAGATGPAGSGGGAGGGCVLVSNPTSTHFTDCENDLTSLWGRGIGGPVSWQYANFSGSNLTDAVFYGGDLSFAIFRGSILQGTDFRAANLTGVDFTNADLRRFYGPNSTLDGTTVVTGVTWANTICPDGTNSDGNGGTCVGHY